MRGAELLGFLSVFAVGESSRQGPPMDKDLQCLSQGRDRDNEDHRGEQHPDAPNGNFACEQIRIFTHAMGSTGSRRSFGAKFSGPNVNIG
jgi:hypothetical protein